MKTLPKWIYSILVWYCALAIWYPFAAFISIDAFKGRYPGPSFGMYVFAALLFLISAVLTYAALTFEKAIKEDERERRVASEVYDRLIDDIETATRPYNKK